MKIFEVILGIFFLMVIMTSGLNIFSIWAAKISYFEQLLDKQADNISLYNWSNYFIESQTGLTTGFITYNGYEFWLSDTTGKFAYNCYIDTYNVFPQLWVTFTGLFCRIYSDDIVIYNYKF